MVELVDLFVLVAFSLQIIFCPYAKVEESFNLQAIHDLLLFGVRGGVAQYDHLEFPGVVPRTFLGAVAVASITSPFLWVWRALGLQKIALQYVARHALAATNFAALLMLKRAIAARYGKMVACFFMAICGCQFHLMFYFGRTLPNTFALALVLCAYAYWIRNKIKQSIVLFTSTIIIFRGDTAVLFAPVLLWMVLHSGFRVNKLFRIITWGITASITALIVTITVDSYFWQRWLWPEGEVLWLNTVENKSGDWGVSPPLWYFYSALPRALLTTSLLIPLGVSSLLPVLVTSKSWKQVRHAVAHAPLLDRSVWTFVWPIAMYIALFSLLPHKELRFIFNAIPIFNMAAAVGAAKLCNHRAKSLFPFLFVAGCMLSTLLGSTFFFMASRANYPGGVAFSQLHALYQGVRELPLSVHIDVSAAMTGVSRFGEEFPAWSYSKDESITLTSTTNGSGGGQLAAFDFLVTSASPALLQQDFELVEAIHGLDYVEIKTFPPQIHTKEMIYILRNRKSSSIIGSTGELV